MNLQEEVNIRWEGFKNTLKDLKTPNTLSWLQSGFFLVGFATGALIASGIDLYSRIAIPQSVDSEVISEEENCRDQGGRYDNENKTCILVTSDRGNTCKDSADCSGWCLADEGLELGIQGEGKCSENFDVEGCVNFIDKGEINSICLPE